MPDVVSDAIGVFAIVFSVGVLTVCWGLNNIANELEEASKSLKELIRVLEKKNQNPETD